MSRPWPLGARQALKGAHVVLAGLWLGAATVLVLLQLVTPSSLGDGLRGLTAVMVLLDDYVIIPSATGIVLSGIAYGLRTQWGFVRFDWVIVKWAASLAFIAFGALLLGPWIETMDELARASGPAAMTDPAYASARRNVLGWGSAQTVALAALVFVSIFKPWGRR